MGDSDQWDDGGRPELHRELPPEVEYPDRTPPGDGSGQREAWRKRSATGAILTGFAFGLREVLEPPRSEPAIVMETSGVPPTDLPVEADLADVQPKQSVVRIRPWLLGHEPGLLRSTATPTRPARRRSAKRLWRS